MLHILVEYYLPCATF